jgi:hypothetical protein
MCAGGCERQKRDDFDVVEQGETSSDWHSARSVVRTGTLDLVTDTRYRYVRNLVFSRIRFWVGGRDE